MRLLIVEDEQDLGRTMAQVLRSDGYEVDACGDGGTALELATVESYDLILLDLNLPVMDGMEVLRRLRMENAEVKILILSARTELQDKVDGLDFGANDYLTKPFHFAELEARIRSLTRRRFVQRAIASPGIIFDRIVTIYFELNLHNAVAIVLGGHAYQTLRRPLLLCDKPEFLYSSGK